MTRRSPASIRAEWSGKSRRGCLFLPWARAAKATSQPPAPPESRCRAAPGHSPSASPSPRRCGAPRTANPPARTGGRAGCRVATRTASAVSMASRRAGQVPRTPSPWRYPGPARCAARLDLDLRLALPGVGVGVGVGVGDGLPDRLLPGALAGRHLGQQLEEVAGILWRLVARAAIPHRVAQSRTTVR
jgi:hypothetical protein